jgi:hypothetical protein
MFTINLTFGKKISDLNFLLVGVNDSSGNSITRYFKINNKSISDNPNNYNIIDISNLPVGKKNFSISNFLRNKTYNLVFAADKYVVAKKKESECFFFSKISITDHK